jgi:hypothetical protein
MQDRDEQQTHITPLNNALYKALEAIRDSGIDGQREVGLTAALIANYHRWLLGESIYVATQVAPYTSALYKALQAIRNSGLDCWTEISLTGTLIATYNRWLLHQVPLRQTIRRAGSELAK